MPPLRTTPKRPSRTYRSGYVEPSAPRADGRRVCVCRYKGAWKTLDLVWLDTAANEAESVRQLDAWITDIIAGRIEDPTIPKRLRVASVGTSKPTLLEAARIYRDAKLSPRPEDAGDERITRRFELKRALFKRTLKSIFSSDQALDNDFVRTSLEAWLRNPLGAPRFRRNGEERPRVRLNVTSQIIALSELWQFIRYCLASGWLTVDPRPLLNLPSPQVYPEPEELSDEQFKAILAWLECAASAPRCHRTPNHIEQMANYLRALDASGMRSQVEMLSLRHRSFLTEEELLAVNWFDEARIVINRTKGRVKRQIPVSELPELARIIAAQARYLEVNGGKLFPWGDNQSVIRVLKKCLPKLGLSLGNRPLHYFRGRFEARLRSQGVEEDLYLIIVGHKRPAYRSNYERTMPAEEVARRLRMQRERYQSTLNASESIGAHQAR